MSEQDDALSDLQATRIVDGLRWAHRTTYRRVMADYDPDTGHDQALIGTHAYIVLQDRIDRVFSCRRFSVSTDDPDPNAGRDLLLAGILQSEFEEMPVLPPGTVVRSDLNGSPGWQHKEWRWLLAGGHYRSSDNISWPEKSVTKQQVAKQHSADDLALFSVDEAVGHVTEACDAPSPTASDTVVNTLILAHSVDRDTGDTELFLGRPRYNEGGGYAWYWKTSLLSLPPGSAGGGGVPDPQQPPGPDANDVSDAPVRLRPESDEAAAEDAGRQT